MSFLCIGGNVGMWGILIGIAIYAIALVILIGKEGMREYNTKIVWTKEEVEKVKGASIMGWKLLIVVIFLVGAALLGYCSLHKMPDKDQLSQQNGIVTKITESGDGTLEVYLQNHQKPYVIPNDAKRLLDQKKLEATKQTKTEISILYRSEKGLLKKEQTSVIYDLKRAKKQLLAYEEYQQSYLSMNHLWVEISLMLFTIAILSMGLLLYAKKNPEMYKVICIMKPEKAIRPTLAQKVSREVDDILTKNLESENGRVDAGYYGKIRRTFKNSEDKKQD